MTTAINIISIPSWFHSDDGQIWECAHISTEPEVVEHYDHYKEAVTGQPQPLFEETIETCLTCPAWFSFIDEEWHDE